MNIPVWQIHRMENVVRQARGVGGLCSEVEDCMEETRNYTRRGQGPGVRSQGSASVLVVLAVPLSCVAEMPLSPNP
jgi:hypothetical protein